MIRWRWLALTAALGCLLVSACSSGEPAAVAEEGDPDADQELSQFCEVARSIEGELPEAYVGSAEHINDIMGLATLAPEAITGQAAAYRDFLYGGGVDPDDPESNVLLNWPTDVQAAVNELIEFISVNC